MTIYLLTFLLSIISLWLSTKSSGLVRYALLFASILLPTILAGCRDMKIGADTQGYQYDVFLTCCYNKSIKNILASSYVEPLYTFMMWCASKVFANFNFCLFVSHLILLCTIMIAIIRLKINVVFPFILFYLCFYCETLNLTRQHLASAFCLLSFAEFTNAKYLKSMCAFVVSYFFHNSSLIFLSVILILYATEKYRIMLKREIYFLMFLLVIIILFSFKEIVLNLSQSEMIKSEYVERYADAKMYGSSLPVALLAINTFNLFMFLILKKTIKDDKKIAFFTYMFMLSFLFCFLGAISIFAVRIGLYFMIVSILYCMPYMLKNAYLRYKNIVTIFYMFYWYMVVGVANMGKVYPYQSVLLDIF